MIYKVCKRLIAAGQYDAEDMKTKLDVYLMYGRITQEQYEELMGMIAADEESASGDSEATE